MAEKEYIEREYMVEIITMLKSEKGDIRVMDTETLLYFIRKIPAADVEPVRHGKWIYNPNGMDFNLGAWECSVCTQKNNNLPCSRNISPYICVGSKYCPNCGAKMFGGEEND